MSFEDDHKRLNKALLIIIIVVIFVLATIIIITNAVISDWGIFEIFTAIGTTFLIIGGLGVYTSYAGGVSASSRYLDAGYPDLAVIDAQYARKRRLAFPTVSFILMAIGAIFLGIGLFKRN